jgi:hypothetical protein
LDAFDHAIVHRLENRFVGQYRAGRFDDGFRSNYSEAGTSGNMWSHQRSLSFRLIASNMKRSLMAIPLIAGSMLFAGCAGPNSGSASGGSGVSGGIDPITQAGIDATNAATQEQSNQDTRAAFEQMNAASANQ